MNFFMSGDNPGAATALTDQNRRKLAAKLRQTHAALQPGDRDGYCRYISERLEAAAQDEAEKARKSRARAQELEVLANEKEARQVARAAANVAKRAVEEERRLAAAERKISAARKKHDVAKRQHIKTLDLEDMFKMLSAYEAGAYTRPHDHIPSQPEPVLVIVARATVHFQARPEPFL